MTAKEIGGYVRVAREIFLERHLRERRPLVDRLISDFGRYVDAFDANRQFSGPSLYFHVQALAARRSHDSAVEALDDEGFFDSLYATLASWGMHRMGPGAAKLVEIDRLKASFRAQRDRIAELQALHIEDIAEADVADVSIRIWELMRALRVGVGETLLVANSKALHHLLPDLVPPIDRRYTLKFFIGSTSIYAGRDADYFRALYPLFREIAATCAADIRERVLTPCHGMNTSVTKVIDNAILGYMPFQSDADEPVGTPVVKMLSALV